MFLQASDGFFDANVQDERLTHSVKPADRATFRAKLCPCMRVIGLSAVFDESDV
jgi:hypothetical protein